MKLIEKKETDEQGMSSYPFSKTGFRMSADKMILRMPDEYIVVERAL